jgi:hypothetical protein
MILVALRQCSIVALADSGETEAALKLVQELEGEPRDFLQAPRDKSLIAIAKAYQKSSDATAELAVAARIESLSDRW